MLIIENYKKEYRHGFKLSIDQLELESGIHFLKGNNGSGKSTLLRSIAGLIRFKGDISFNNISIKKQPNDFKKAMGFAEAEPEFPDFLSLEALASVVLTAKNIKKDEYEQLIDLFGVSSFHKQPIGTYSSGMIKKASLTLALLGEPQLILLDEPFTTIDKQTKAILLEKMTAILASGKTILFSSHEALELKQFDIKTTITFSEGKVKIL